MSDWINSMIRSQSWCRYFTKSSKVAQYKCFSDEQLLLYISKQKDEIQQKNERQAKAAGNLRTENMVLIIFLKNISSWTRFHSEENVKNALGTRQDNKIHTEK